MGDLTLWPTDPPPSKPGPRRFGGLLGFKAKNHPQQTERFGAAEDVDDRGTTWEDFTPLDQRFRFTLDAAASAHNAKVDRYFTKADNGLEQSWAGERVWCNPPFSDLGAWVRKAWLELDSAELVVMLVPANRTEQGWWQEHVEPFRDRAPAGLRTEFLPGRMRFIRHGAGHDAVRPNERPPFGCVLLIWDPRALDNGSSSPSPTPRETPSDG